MWHNPNRPRANRARVHTYRAGSNVTACRRIIPPHAVFDPGEGEMVCLNCVAHTTGVWRTGRPPRTAEAVRARPCVLPDLATAEGRQELLDAHLEEYAAALGYPSAALDSLPPTVATVRDLMLAPLGDDDPFTGAGRSEAVAPRMRRVYAASTGLPVPCDPDALDAWVVG